MILQCIYGKIWGNPNGSISTQEKKNQKTKNCNLWTQPSLGQDTWAGFFSPVKAEVFGGCWCRTGSQMMAYLVSSAEWVTIRHQQAGDGSGRSFHSSQSALINVCVCLTPFFPQDLMATLVTFMPLKISPNYACLMDNPFQCCYEI